MEYKSRPILVLSKHDIERVITMPAAIMAIERALCEYSKGRAQMPPKIYLNLSKYKGDFRAMPAYVCLRRTSAGKPDFAGIKWVNVHEYNKKFGLPTVMATIILSDPKTGYPIAIMDGTYITKVRTGAAGGIAARYLARKDSRILGLVGCGTQAESQLEALLEYFRFSAVRVWGLSGKCERQFMKKFAYTKLDFICAKNVKECVTDADIIVTTTPSRRPLVKFSWVKKGAHINAIGADAPGKEEIDPDILKNSKLVVDDLTQAKHSGEINVPYAKRLIRGKDIYAALGDIVAGKKRGRMNDSEITVFDSTGLAIQDIALAGIVYNKCIKLKLGKNIKL